MFNKRVIFIIVVFTLFDALVWGMVFSGKTASGLELYFPSVGQGDSSLIILPGNRKILIDGGPIGALPGELAKILPANDHYIDLVLMTHPQLDHFGGFIDVIKNYDIGAFIGSGRKGEIEAYKKLKELLTGKHIPFVALAEGDRITYEASVLSILSPSPSQIISGELNDTTLVTMLDSQGVRALYTGDIDAVAESRLAKKYDIHADVLKIAHHGSRFSSSEEFLKAVNPKVSIIEVGKNTYGHPAPSTVEKLKRYGQRFFRTDQSGNIKIAPGQASALEVFNLK